HRRRMEVFWFWARLHDGALDGRSQIAHHAFALTPVEVLGVDRGLAMTADDHVDHPTSLSGGRNVNLTGRLRRCLDAIPSAMQMLDGTRPCVGNGETTQRLF